MIYIDTSALLAIVDDDDSHHATAQRYWQNLLEGNELLQTNNYVLVESHAIIQNRVGLWAIRRMVDELLPAIEIDWLDTEQHKTAVQSLLIANRRNLSLVDCSSFETMRCLGIRTVFTFDEHFKEQGFDVVP
jgi:predicted nucleic acid-binding protein